MNLTTYRVRVRVMLAQGYNCATETYVTAENTTQARYMIEAQYGRDAFVGFCD